MKLKEIIKYFCNLFIIIIFATPVFGQATRPTDFRGIKWGTPIKNIQGLKKIDSYEDRTHYIRKSDKLIVADKPVERILYHAIDGKLIAVTVNFTGYDTYLSIERLMKNLYGKPDDVSNTTTGIERTWFAKENSEATVTLRRGDVIDGIQYGSIYFEWKGYAKSKLGF